jgi:hypothetical protein
MTDRLIEACAYALECYLEMLFENPVKIPNTGMAEIPVIGGPYILDLEDRSQFFPTIIAALAARERFRREAPEGPVLPLRQEDCEKMLNDDRPRIGVVGLYADSWRFAQWDRQHPHFGDYVCGLLACEYAPPELRHDRSLLKEFLPCPLEGLCDGQLYWRSPEKLTFDLERQAACDAFMARERTGAPPPQ